MNRAVLFWTSIVSSSFFVLSLKFYDVFHFIDWKPLGWSKRYHVFEESPGLLRWIVLFLIIFIFSLLLYYLAKWAKKAKPAIMSLIVGLIIALLIEWMIQRPNELGEYFKDFSIPFGVLVLITTRFIVETAIFNSVKPFSDPK
ncbi:hypothetical protein ACFOZY_11995 [Chungangia koreensis]|uniref:Uncharacterized protein n=1 Tax=Chungangia koreensis TaxID=752657 RepID=A0ABV8X6G9_9LACT